eukprot:1933286-Rhodomonas_salina.6
MAQRALGPKYLWHHDVEQDDAREEARTLCLLPLLQELERRKPVHARGHRVANRRQDVVDHWSTTLASGPRTAFDAPRQTAQHTSLVHHVIVH